MLDENLPAFFLKSSSTGVKHHRDVFTSHHGSDPAPTYTLQNVDPNSTLPTHKNCYAAALFDAYNPDILYGEVLARPGWTQPTLSAEELRKNGGVPPAPQPILPTEFVVQLYEPEQQIRVEVREGKWGGSQTYEFSMPIYTFRTPSASNLDRGQSDPASLAITPKTHFVWRKESKLSKDLTCFMTGRSTDTVERKKLLGSGQRKDPDIAIALWRGLRELTLYESNVQRLEMEDPKGLEVVLLLGAVVIRDLFFSTKDQLRDVFNINDIPGERKLSGGGRKLSNPNQTNPVMGMPNSLDHRAPPPSAYRDGQRLQTPNDERRSSLPKLQTTSPAPPRPRPPPPMPDPRAQWQLDAETTRLKREAEAEARRAAEEKRRREKADEAEARRLQKILEAEQKEKRRKEAEIEKETERLRKQYGVQQLPPSFPPRPHPAPQANSSNPRHGKGKGRASQPYMQTVPQGGLAPPAPPRGSNGMYVQPSASASSVMMSGGNGNASLLNLPGSDAGQAGARKKKSFFGLRSLSDDGATEAAKLKKKGSSMW